MHTSIPPGTLAEVLAGLGDGNRALARRFPGERPSRQPVHTVYGGAHLFRADTAHKLGQIALRAFQDHAPDAAAMARAMGMTGADELPRGDALAAALQRPLEALRAEAPALWLATTVHQRVRAKLEREAVEDYRLDFEDGFGDRPNPEEDATAAAAAREVARGLREGTLPPFLGLRIKSMAEETKARGARTLDIFVSTILEEAGALPPHLVVTVPKVNLPDHVVAVVKLLRALESANGLAEGTIAVELMIESTQAILTADGRSALPAMLAAAEGRCRGVHLGIHHLAAPGRGPPGVRVRAPPDPGGGDRQRRRHRRRTHDADPGGDPRGRPPRLAAVPSRHPARVDRRLLPGLGSPPGADPGALRDLLRLLPQRRRACRRAPRQLHPEGRPGDPRGQRL
jgi:hypothetical protein